MDATDEEDALDQLKNDKEEMKKEQKKKDSNDILKNKPVGILPDEKKKSQKQSTDSLNN